MVDAKDMKIEVPDDFDFSPEDIAKISSRAKLKEGYYQAVVREAKRTVSKKGHLMITLTVYPLARENDSESELRRFRLSSWVCIPVRNPNWKDHEAPETGGLCRNFAQAILGEDVMPSYPRKDNKSGAWTYNGDEVDGFDVEQLKQEADNVLLQQLKTWYQNPAVLQDEAVYIKVGYDKDGEYKDSPKIVEFAKELPPKAELVPEDEQVVGGELKVLIGGKSKKAEPAPKAKAKGKK